jgi:hypothetical protein
MQDSEAAQHMPSTCMDGVMSPGLGNPLTSAACMPIGYTLSGTSRLGTGGGHLNVGIILEEPDEGSTSRISGSGMSAEAATTGSERSGGAVPEQRGHGCAGVDGVEPASIGFRSAVAGADSAHDAQRQLAASALGAVAASRPLEIEPAVPSQGLGGLEGAGVSSALMAGASSSGRRRRSSGWHQDLQCNERDLADSAEALVAWAVMDIEGGNLDLEPRLQGLDMPHEPDTESDRDAAPASGMADAVMRSPDTAELPQPPWMLATFMGESLEGRGRVGPGTACAGAASESSNRSSEADLGPRHVMHAFNYRAAPPAGGEGDEGDSGGGVRALGMAKISQGADNVARLPARFAEGWNGGGDCREGRVNGEAVSLPELPELTRDGAGLPLHSASPGSARGDRTGGGDRWLLNSPHVGEAPIVHRKSFGIGSKGHAILVSAPLSSEPCSTDSAEVRLRPTSAGDISNRSGPSSTIGIGSKGRPAVQSVPHPQSTQLEVGDRRDSLHDGSGALQSALMHSRPISADSKAGLTGCLTGSLSAGPRGMLLGPGEPQQLRCHIKSCDLSGSISCARRNILLVASSGCNRPDVQFAPTPSGKTLAHFCHLAHTYATFAKMGQCTW